jgi:hypothetical protein
VGYTKVHLVLCGQSNQLPTDAAVQMQHFAGMSGEEEMISNRWKLASVLGVAGAIALSAASAEARDARKTAPVRGAVASDAYAYRWTYPFAYSPSDPYAYQPATRDAYGYIDNGVGYGGSGTFSDGRQVPGTNWNPNQ